MSSSVNCLVIVEACLLFLKVNDNEKENPVSCVSVEVDYTHCYLLHLLLLGMQARHNCSFVYLVSDSWGTFVFLQQWQTKKKDKLWETDALTWQQFRADRNRPRWSLLTLLILKSASNKSSFKCDPNWKWRYVVIASSSYLRSIAT